MTTRRGFLIATAGGWLTGQLAPGPRGCPGSRIGASHAAGHLVRDGFDGPTSSAVAKADVVVVGAGVSGLSAAWRLAPAGLDVTVLELEAFVGGTSAWGEEGVVQHPWGAHYLPAPNPEARATQRLLEEMGVLTGWDPHGRPHFDPRVLCHAPEDRIFYQGVWYPGLVPDAALSAAERSELVRFLQHAEDLTNRRGADGRYLFQIPIFESSRDAATLELDTLSMAQWLDREGFVTPFVRWFVRYATLDDFGSEPDDVSAWAGLHYFAARKLKTPELEGSHYLVWPEGNGRLVKALTRAGPTIVNGAVVLDIERIAGGVRVTFVDQARGEAKRIEARGAVLAVPAFVARRLTPSSPRLPEARKSSPWMVANLHVERPIDPNQTWDSVLHGAEGLGYVDASHQLSPPRGRTVLTYFRAYGERDVAARRRDLIERSLDSLADDVFADLEPAHPDLREQTARVDVVVWGHAMPRPTPGFLGKEPFVPHVRLDERVTWGHVDQAGMALFEEAQRAGVIAAEELARSIGVTLGESWA